MTLAEVADLAEKFSRLPIRAQLGIHQAVEASLVSPQAMEAALAENAKTIPEDELQACNQWMIEAGTKVIQRSKKA